MTELEKEKLLLKISNKQDEMQEEFQRLKNTVTVIEYEHGKKLDLILEVLTGHTDKLEQHEDRFDKDEKIIEMHGHQIYGLEKKLKA